ncbi:type IV secretion system protein [Bartonella sp. CB175]|uniref:type IV secretion system protein n=1 Tax=Bartonella sp. CB175 TaxID=3112256 RepID=UPI00300E3494
MALVMFTQLFGKIDDVINQYVTKTSSEAIIAIAPILSTAIAVSFIIYGWLIMRGVIEMPLTEFVNRCLRVSIITSIAFSAGWSQGGMSSFVSNLPTELSNALTGKTSQNEPFSNSLNKAAEEGFKRASEAFEESAFLGSDGLLYALFGILILVATSSLVAIGGAVILFSQSALSLLFALGPVFIIALLWQPTHRFFERWATQLLSYIILMILLSTVFKLMINIFAAYMEDLQFNGEQNVSYALGGALTLSIISIVLLLKLSSLASTLAKGITFGHLLKLNANNRSAR